jgi:hypothetical protein
MASKPYVTYTYTPLPSYGWSAPQPPQQHTYPPYQNAYLPHQNAHPPHQYTYQPQVPVPAPRRRKLDISTLIALPLVWLVLVLTTGVMILMTDDINSTDDVTGTISFSFLPILVASVLNEVVVDRCWRRIVWGALGDSTSADNAKLARNLRAANFQWLNFLKRMFTADLSLRDWRSVLSFIFIRWGTAVGIASCPFSVHFTEFENTGNYFAIRRYYWIPGPAVVHGLSIALALAIWGLPPWKVFSGGYDDVALLARYQPYLDRVSGGSIASSDEVATFLAPKHQGERSATLRKRFVPGRHVVEKFSGVWSGILFSHVPPIVVGVLVNNGMVQRRLTDNEILFAIHLAFLAQNIFYLFALDFIVWNLTLEGMCKTSSSKPKRTMGHLGTNSGVMLIVKAVTQGRPVKVAIFFWLFWLQAVVIRGLSLLIIVSVETDGYGTDVSSQLSSWDGSFWLGWIVITSGIIVPLVAVWVFWPHQAPVSGQDGWRWATIARTAVHGRGNYGIKHGRACWGLDVSRFNDWTGGELE